MVPLVAVYDPDPIASLRKRRVSTDSHDSVTSHGHGEPRAGQEVRRQPSSKLAEEPAPHADKRKVRGAGEGQKLKKKHKKSHKHERHGHHGHHSCHKHKHRRHGSGSAEAAAKSKHEAEAGAKHVAPQQAEERSPLYQELDPEEADTSEQEASQEEETDHHNTSDDEEVKEFKQLLLGVTLKSKPVCFLKSCLHALCFCSVTNSVKLCKLKLVKIALPLTSFFILY